jgi:hypothetical protein
MAELIRGALAGVLEGRRARFNALFARTKKAVPQLDANLFADLLREQVVPVMEAVAGGFTTETSGKEAPDKTIEVGEVLFEVALELVGKDLVSKYPVLKENWRTLLAGAAKQLIQEPRGVAVSLTNALCCLSQTLSARPEEWIAAMVDIARQGVAARVLLEAGKAAAWRAGLAHFRQGALAVCRQLDVPVASRALGLASEPDGTAWKAILDRLETDPWFDPAIPSKKRALQLVKHAGGFQGFGGPFTTPPRVWAADAQLLAEDADGRWLITADRFGATFHRTTVAGAKSTAPAGLFQIAKSGLVSFGKESRRFEQLANSQSTAADATTLAVTLPHSHFVYLVAFTEEAP